MILVPGKGKDVLVDLINQQNALPYPITPDEVYISAPKTLGGVYPTAVEVKVIPMPGSVYEGEVPVDYRRLDLTSAFGEMRPRVVGRSNGNLHSMLPFISKELGMDLRPEDFVQVDYDWLDENEEANIHLVAERESLSYVGSFTIQFTRRRTQLLEALNVTRDADNLRVPGASVIGLGKGLRQVDMVTWAYDFSEHYNAIRRHKWYNIAGNPSALRALMYQKFGFANWPYGWNHSYRDLATSQVPEANQDYERVIVQRIVDLSVNKTLPYEGTAYLHYNVT